MRSDNAIYPIFHTLSLVNFPSNTSILNLDCHKSLDRVKQTIVAIINGSRKLRLKCRCPLSSTVPPPAPDGSEETGGENGVPNDGDGSVGSGRQPNPTIVTGEMEAPVTMAPVLGAEANAEGVEAIPTTGASMMLGIRDGEGATMLGVGGGALIPTTVAACGGVMTHGAGEATTTPRSEPLMRRENKNRPSRR